MREWNLSPGDPLALTLAADARLSHTDYLNDQIWELTLGKGSPPAIALQTTFGLRARLMRMFPRFLENDKSKIDPADFVNQIVVETCLPNFIRLVGMPLEDIEIAMEIWVPLSQAICGKVFVRNLGLRDRQIRVEWIGQLTPNEGQRLAPVEIQGVSVLAGKTSNLAPVIFLTNGPKFGSGSYPCLSLSFDLSPKTDKTFTWVEAALESQEASFSLARSLATSRWEAEKARMEMLNAGQVEIITGDPDWDACLMLSQKAALSLFLSASRDLPEKSLVHNRQPDQGFSFRGDGSDYSHLWNGQSILDVYSVSQILNATAPDLIAGLVKNFLAIQEENGFIDMKPGLSGQRSRLLAAPILSSLIVQLDQLSSQTEFLKQAYPKLLAFFDHWFSPLNDRDQDGIPEWTHPIQFGQENHPVYSPWDSWSQGVNITTTESPALCAFLYKECQSLLQIGEQLGFNNRKQDLQTKANQLAEAVERAWDENRHVYLDWDRDTHVSTNGELIAQTNGNGLILLQRSFRQPKRLIIQIFSSSPSISQVKIFIHGTNQAGRHRVEQISYNGFRVSPGKFTSTTDSVYSTIEQIEIHGLSGEDQISVYQVNLSHPDHSHFTPLWAGITSKERASVLIEQTLLDPERFWKPFGVPVCTDMIPNPEGRICQAGSLFWHQIIGESLLAYGYREEAMQLVSRLLNAVGQTLRSGSNFRQYTDSNNGDSWGELNALNGLAPVGLFLKTLGVQFSSNRRLIINGFNPFPWPIIVKYRGIELLCEKDLTTITFADGQKILIDDPSPRLISLEHTNR